MIHHEQSADTMSVVTKTAPPWIAVFFDRVLGLSLNDWVMVLALIYTFLQIVVLVKKNFFPGKTGTGEGGG